MHQSAYWALGHFSRFIRPGAQRVLCASSRADVETTAFLDPSGAVASVALNRHGHPVHMQLVVDGSAWPIDLPPHSIATFVVPTA